MAAGNAGMGSPRQNDAGSTSQPWQEFCDATQWFMSRLEIATMRDIEDLLTALMFGGVIIFCLRAFFSWLDKRGGFA